MRAGRQRTSSNVDGLISERVPIEEAPAAYERLVGERRRRRSGSCSSTGETALAEPHRRRPRCPRRRGHRQPAGCGLIGAGSFAQRILIPGLARAGFVLAVVASASGLSARAAAERFGFARAARVEEVLADPDVGGSR